MIDEHLGRFGVRSHIVGPGAGPRDEQTSFDGDRGCQKLGPLRGRRVGGVDIVYLITVSGRA